MAVSDQRSPSTEAAQRSARDDKTGRRPVEQEAEDVSKIIAQAVSDASTYGREIGEAAARVAEDYAKIWVPFHAAGAFYAGLARSFAARTRHFERSLTNLADVYQKATEDTTNDLRELVNHNIKLWFDLQRIPWTYFQFPDRPKLPASYEVRSGDTLSAIALHFYGDDTEPLWRKIYDANRGVIGADPQQVKPGERLTIPA